MDLETVIRRAGTYLPESDLELIRQAYDRMAEAVMEAQHEQQEPPPVQALYAADVMHALDVAHNLAELGQDAHTVAAGLLYVGVDRAGLDPSTLADLDGEAVELVSSLMGLAGVAFHLDEIDKGRSERQTENLRNMFLSMAQDPRVVLIMLTDRLHMLRALRHAEESPLRRRLAHETLEVFAPLAGRLGIYRLKWALEDLGFRCDNPQAYNEIAEKLSERRQDREAQVKVLIERIEQALQAEGVTTAKVVGRPKHIYSIYKKMQRKNVPFEQIYDVRAVRVIVETIPQCYIVLGVIHNLWHPRPRGFDD
jgi:GTP pyrophosphokinase